MRELLARLGEILPAVREREEKEPEAFPARTIADLYAIGLPRAPFSVGLGGTDGSLRDGVDAIETLASVSPAAALLISMPLSLAGFVVAGAVAAPPAHRAACAAQAEQVASDYRAGQIYAACNSEKGAGGSLAATQTMAHRKGVASGSPARRSSPRSGDTRATSSPPRRSARTISPAPARWRRSS